MRNINKTFQSVATADLLVNNWYGHITQNTTWGPNKVFAITGDITVDVGKTLTIESGTTIYFQANEDNQSSGVDIAKCEMRVDSGGALIIKGTAASPVKILSSKPEAQASTEDWRGIVIKPGGVFACSNAVIRHAYAGIEDSSGYLHTIKNVRIGRCKIYGIYAANTDSLTIRGCRVDSVSSYPSGGFGIYVRTEASTDGAKLVSDTVKACYYGMFIYRSVDSVVNCVIEGDTSLSYIGIHTQGHFYIDSTKILPVVGTTINGYFSAEHFQNFQGGRSFLTNCALASATTPYRSPDVIRTTAGPNYLKLRRSEVTNWGANGIVTAHINGQVTNLGTAANPLDSGNNEIVTTASGSGWKYVYDVECSTCTSPQIKAELNQWNAWPPPSYRFSPNVDRNPYLTSGGGPGRVAVGEEKEKEILPKPTELYQNYPNPFNPTTLIQFNLEKPERVSLEIFNILGQRVRKMLSGEPFAAGPYTFLWDGKDDRGSPVSSGMYVYKLQTPTYLQTKKMMLVK
ncbi:MAG: T9SS type A sorting domain-containing protein [candidate division Zixibacteria bacterium]|nr:T9SS type A sorting domain-containing protein [candidate division Zixibacteria bacterium]